MTAAVTAATQTPALFHTHLLTVALDCESTRGERAGAPKANGNRRLAVGNGLAPWPLPLHHSRQDGKVTGEDEGR